jgi:hypothetical protein
LTAVQHFINRDNINEIIAEAGFAGEIGILSIDIDGNDYWIWERIDVVSPILVIIEYNSAFGHKIPVTIPYDATFDRTKAHYSNLYWGCSLKALCSLADRKGYAFVGSNSAGLNAYFIRKDKIGNLEALSAEAGYQISRIRESRDALGQLSFLSGIDRLKAIKDMPIYNLEENVMIKVSDLLDQSPSLT